MSRALLDINVLLALLDSDHIEHERARAWIDAEIDSGWASCAITQNGFVRVKSASPATRARSRRRSDELLGQACAEPHHEFWPCDVTLLDASATDRIRHGPRQVTDAYLLALATHHEGRFVTFDHSISMSAVPAATPANLTTL